MKERLGVGIIGAGFVTNTFHLPSWRYVRHADIVAICAPHREKAERSAAIARKLKVGEPRVYTDVKEMVNDPNVHAIWIAVPNYARLPVVRKIVEACEGNGHLIGVACEKPLARNVKEAQEMVDLIKQAGLLHGYLENQVFAPSVVRGKEILWARGASNTGRPYLARCAEEHAGPPHGSWFWSGERQGGGTLNDMGCHSVEVSRFLLTAPGESRESLVPRAVTAEIAALKWIREGYVDQVDEGRFRQFPVEDFARGTIVYEASSGEICMAEIRVSWSYMGPGLRLSFEVQGPEYSMEVNSLNSELRLFLSRRVIGKEGEDFVEKQQAEQGQMPVIPDEPVLYGYVGENQHMVERFLDGKLPDENWYDGLAVVKLVMSLYMSAEYGKRLAYPPKGLDEYVPPVARGSWDPRSIARGHSE